MEEIAKIILASGVSGLFIALVLYFFVQPAIQKSVEHAYEKMMEQVRTDHALVQKRYDIAATSVENMTALYDELAEELKELKFTDGQKPLSTILHDFHSTYRSRFRRIRSQLEPTNDLLSFYSISFDAILHPNSIKEILESCQDLKKPSDVKYAYRSIWMLVVDSMNSLLRVSASHKFWSPEDPYPERARAWAEHEKNLIIKHLYSLFSEDYNHDGYFSLQIETQEGVRRFWKEIPSA